MSAVITVRDVRVLLVDHQSQCRIGVTGAFSIRSNGNIVLRGRDVDRAVVTADRDRGIRFGDRMLGRGLFDLIPESDASIRIARHDGGRWTTARPYPGFLRLSISPRGRLRVVNFVDIETYVACVLPGEMPSYFHPEAQRAQAVAVRTYVLYQMASRPHDAYDVTATEASQVYLGLQTGKAFERAREAAGFTRGIVGTWSSPEGERIVCTFYSACCGGVTQDVTNCRSDFPKTRPLSGGARCDCYKVAPGQTYRWSPVALSKSEITSKLVARYPTLRNLGRIEQIKIVDRTATGRPKVFQLVGDGGQTSRLVAEDFRLAIGSHTLRSTNLKLRTERERFVFTDGKGFGHGMGLCQWGAQAMALDGHRAGVILKHYFPTMNLTRAY